MVSAATAQGSEPIRVLLADDHTLVRAGLRALLEGIPNVEVVAEVSDGSEAARLTEELRPDLVLLDIAMPLMTGLEALRHIRAHCPMARVLLLSMYDNKEYVTNAIQSGASGYLIKDAAVHELGLAVAAVVRGETYLSPRVSHQLAQAFVTKSSETNPLTPRQVEILRLVAQGHSSKEIARLLSLSVKTVETHRSQIMERLAINDLAGLVRYSVRQGIVSADE